MIVPQYWAEARLHERHRGRAITVRRFGWSDESPDAARAHAEARTRQALDAILAGADLPRRERRSNYGIEGVPIREQIVERHGDVVVTRNSYGALCLNTPDVLFVDVDFEEAPSGCALPPAGLLAAIGIGGAVGVAWGWLYGVAVGIAISVAVNAITTRTRKVAHARDGGPEARARARIDAFVASHPDWHLRLYRTPAGLRVMAMHDVFDPLDRSVGELFHALQADRLYSLMCKVQHCFRARLTAKPWRIGMVDRIRPPVAAWSAEQASLPERLAWIAVYERKAAGHAACRYVASLGRVSDVHPKAREVRDLHDGMTRAESALPLA